MALQVRRMSLVIVALLIVSVVALLANSMLFQSSAIGILASIFFISSSSSVIGKLLYPRENTISRAFLSVTTLLIILALIGTVFIFLAKFTEIATLITFIAIALSLTSAVVIFDRKWRQQIQDSSPKESYETVDLKDLILGLPLIVSVSVAFGLLWLSRTGEGGSSVWLTIPSFFGGVYLIAGLSLAFLIFFANLHQSLKLALVCAFSFLSHSLFVLVWYPGEYGDQWSHLGEARYIAKTGMPYAYDYILQNSLWVDLVKFKVQYSLVIFFERMFCVDIYWVHVLLVPVLWSILLPFVAFKIAETLAVKRSKAFPLLTAMVTVVFSSLVAWGAVSVPNSLSFAFLFTSIALILLWMKQGGRRIWVIALLAALASLFAHPQPGSFAFMFLFLGTVIQKTSRKILWIASFLLMLVLYPVLLYLNLASFTPIGLFQITSFMAFQSVISTILLIFGLVGLVLGIKGRFVDSKASLLFFGFYVVVLFEYYFTTYGMANLPYGPARILAIADFLLVPLIALGFFTLVGPLRRNLSTGKNTSLRLISRKISVKVNPQVVGLLLIGLFLSLQATAALYQAYPWGDPSIVQPSAYELEAIQFIDSNSPERYVVVCEPGFASIATGFLGKDYAYGAAQGLFGPPYWSYPTVQMYLMMTRNPSIGIMRDAMNFANAKLTYFVVSVRNPDFDEVVDRVLEIIPDPLVFGDGQLYVFMYPLPVFEEPGSAVKVVFDDGLGGEENVSTRFAYMFESEINSTLTLSEHTSYNVTEFPMHWTFLELTVNNESRRFDNSSDINTFIYMKGLQQTDVLTIKWLFNRRYPNVGWKEDSFKSKAWRQGPYPSDITPTIVTDGNILRISYFFIAGSLQDYYYSAPVNISTNDYPYLLMRWRSDRPIAVAAVYFGLVPPSGQEIVRLGSISLEWSTIVVPLAPNWIVRTVMVGLSNARNQAIAGSATLEIDYILFSAKTTP